MEGYSISTFTYCAAASQRGTTGALWGLIEHMDPMTSPSREEQPMTASLDSEAKVRPTAHLAVLTLKSVNFEPAGYPVSSASLSVNAHPHHPLPPTPIAVTVNPSSPLALRSFTHRFGKYDRFTLLLLPPLAP